MPSPHSTLIRNATVVLPDAGVVTDVVLQDGKIAAVDPPAGSRLRYTDDTVDATGLHLIPGVIDDQVHFRDPGLTHKEDLHTGSLACAKGGVRWVIVIAFARRLANVASEGLLAA